MWFLISAKELEQYLDEGRDLYLVDMRDRASYLRGHIRGAVHIPPEAFPGEIRSQPKERFLVLYCYHGPQSMRAAKWLAEQGYQAADVYGGIQAYRGKYLVRGEENV